MRVFFGAFSILSAFGFVWFVFNIGWRGDKLSEWYFWNMVIGLPCQAAGLFFLGPPSILGYYPDVMFLYVPRSVLKDIDRSVARYQDKSVILKRIDSVLDWIDRIRRSQ